MWNFLKRLFIGDSTREPLRMGVLYYADGVTKFADGTTKNNREIADEAVAQLAHGTVLFLPSEFDEHGNRLWEFQIVEIHRG